MCCANAVVDSCVVRVGQLVLDVLVEWFAFVSTLLFDEVGVGSICAHMSRVGWAVSSTMCSLMAGWCIVSSTSSDTLSIALQFELTSFACLFDFVVNLCLFVDVVDVFLAHATCGIGSKPRVV